jgi:hypothetical protein
LQAAFFGLAAAKMGSIRGLDSRNPYSEKPLTDVLSQVIYGKIERLQ